MTSLQLKWLFLSLLSLVLVVDCAEISIGQNEASIAQTRRVYCTMISYHFLDNDMDAFNTLTEGVSSLRREVFKHKVANKLSASCQQRITTEQLMELYRLVSNPNGHEKEILAVQEKYIEYFTPEKDIIIRLLQKVKLESDLEIQKQNQKYHQKRKQIEENSKVVMQGFKLIQKHINQTGHQLFSVLSKFTEAISGFHSSVTQSVEKVKNHPDIKSLKDFWDDL